MEFRDEDFLQASFFERDPLTCARELVGTVLRWNGCAGMVVETEAYSSVGDEACHVFFRKSARAFVEKHGPGAAYVYLNYGMYWLANVLVRGSGAEGFVLIRALEPMAGEHLMRKRRVKARRPEDLCSGPGKLTVALGMDGTFHGKSFLTNPKKGFYRRLATEIEIETDGRIGISRAADLPWRFLIKNNPHVSVPKRRLSQSRKA